MKNQNDLIISIVCGVLALGAAITFYFTKEVPVAPASPQVVPTGRAQLQPGAVVFADSLPGGGGQSGGGGGGGFGGGSAPPTSRSSGGGTAPPTSRGGGGGSAAPTSRGGGGGNGLPSYVAGGQSQ